MVPTVGSGLVISWAGMRGIVTVAAALALPVGNDGAPFPFRDLILLTAFCVVVSTLVIQGLTLGPIMRRVHLNPDDSVEREIGLARAKTAKAALRSAIPARHPFLPGRTGSLRSASVILTSPPLRDAKVRITPATLR